jgi:hypothetical protein
MAFTLYRTGLMFYPAGLVTCNECRPKKRKLCKQRTQDKNAAKKRCAVLEAENDQLRAENVQIRLHAQRLELLNNRLAMIHQVRTRILPILLELAMSCRRRAGRPWFQP